MIQHSTHRMAGVRMVMSPSHVLDVSLSAGYSTMPTDETKAKKSISLRVVINKCTINWYSISHAAETTKHT